MLNLKAEKREVSVKSRHLRRENYIPGVLYGKHMEESIPVKLSLKETELFLKNNDIGSKLELIIDGETHLAMLKDLTREPDSRKLEHLSFVALKKDEKVKSVAKIIIEGRESVRNGVVLQLLSEIHYRALPSSLVEAIKVNVKNLAINENMKVSDLEIAKDPDIEILTPVEDVVVTVTPIKTIVEEPKPEAEAAAEPAEAKKAENK